MTDASAVFAQIAVLSGVSGKPALDAFKQHQGETDANTDENAAGFAELFAAFMSENVVPSVGSDMCGKGTEAVLCMLQPAGKNSDIPVELAPEMKAFRTLAANDISSTVAVECSLEQVPSTSAQQAIENEPPEVLSEKLTDDTALVPSPLPLADEASISAETCLVSAPVAPSKLTNVDESKVVVSEVRVQEAQLPKASLAKDTAKKEDGPLITPKDGPLLTPKQETVSVEQAVFVAPLKSVHPSPAVERVDQALMAVETEDVEATEDDDVAETGLNVAQITQLLTYQLAPAPVPKPTPSRQPEAIQTLDNQKSVAEALSALQVESDHTEAPVSHDYPTDESSSAEKLVTEADETVSALAVPSIQTQAPRRRTSSYEAHTKEDVPASSEDTRSGNEAHMKGDLAVSGRSGDAQSVRSVSDSPFEIPTEFSDRASKSATVLGGDDEKTLDPVTTDTMRLNVVRQETYFAPTPPPSLASQITEQIETELALPTSSASSPDTSQPDSETRVKVLQIRLDPPELGPLTVRMTLKHETLALQVEANKETASLIEKDRDTITGLLRSAGYTVDGLNIQVAPADRAGGNSTSTGSGSFQQMGQQHQPTSGQQEGRGMPERQWQGDGRDANYRGNGDETADKGVPRTVGGALYL